MPSPAPRPVSGTGRQARCLPPVPVAVFLRWEDSVTSPGLRSPNPQQSPRESRCSGGWGALGSALSACPVSGTSEDGSQLCCCADSVSAASPPCPGPGPAAPLLAQADGLQLAAVLVFDPLDALELGVHDERPALRVAQDGGVLRGHAVAREALVVPGGHVRIVGQQAQGVQAFGDGDGDLPGDKGDPLPRGPVRAAKRASWRPEPCVLPLGC